MAPFRRMIHPVHKRTPRMRARLRRAPKPHLGAEIISPTPTQLARLARLSHLERDPLTHLPPTILPCGLTHGYHNPARLVSECQWLLHENVAVAVVRVVVQVATAERRRPYRDL